MPDEAVPGICPWPDPEAVDRAIRDGELVVADEDDLARVVITSEARDALARPPAWRTPLEFNAAAELGKTARHDGRLAVLASQFAVCLWGEDNFHYTMTAVMRPSDEPGRKDIVITLWSQVRDAAIAAGREARDRAQAEYDAGRDPFPGP